MKPFAQQTYYELLEVPVTARMEEIRAAYARLMELYAPDSIAVYALVESDQVDALRARMTEAMEILTDSDLRVEYDKDLGLTPSPTARAAEALASIAAESPEESKKAPEAPVLSGPEAFRASFVSGYSLSYVTSSLQVAPLGVGLVDVPATLVRPEEPSASKAEARESSSAQGAADGTKGAQAVASSPDASNSGSSSIAAETHARAAVSLDNSEAASTSSSAVVAASPVSAAPLSGQGSETSTATDVAVSTGEEPSAASAVGAAASSGHGFEASKSTDAATPTATVAASSPVHDTEPLKPADAVPTTSIPTPEVVVASPAAATSPVHGAETSKSPDAVEAQTGPSSPAVGGPAPVIPEPPAKPTPAAATRTPSAAPASAARGPTRQEPSTSIVVSSVPARSGAARPLGESLGLAQEPAAATGDTSIGQASARTRDVRPRLPDIPSDAEFNGELLRRVREARGYTLHQVADRTRISSRHLENVEADRYTALPAQVYLRGILMNLARELGLDPLRVSKSYLALASEKSGKR